MARKITDTDLERIKEKYLDGRSIKLIAQDFNVGFDTISRYLKKMEIFQYKTRRWTNEEINFLKSNYSTADWDIILKKISRWKKSEIISKASRLKLSREIFFLERCRFRNFAPKLFK